MRELHANISRQKYVVLLPRYNVHTFAKVAALLLLRPPLAPQILPSPPPLLSLPNFLLLLSRHSPSPKETGQFSSLPFVFFCSSVEEEEEGSERRRRKEPFLLSSTVHRSSGQGGEVSVVVAAPVDAAVAAAAAAVKISPGKERGGERGRGRKKSSKPKKKGGTENTANRTKLMMSNLKVQEDGEGGGGAGKLQNFFSIGTVPIPDMSSILFRVLLLPPLLLRLFSTIDSSPLPSGDGRGAGWREEEEEEDAATLKEDVKGTSFSILHHWYMGRKGAEEIGVKK